MNNIKTYDLYTENVIDNQEYDNEVENILKNSGYVIIKHSRIYQTTLLNKKELLSTVYLDIGSKYNEMIYIDTYSFKKIEGDDNISNYYNDNFKLSQDIVKKLKNKDNVVNYVELPFFVELFNTILVDEFNI